MNTKLYSIAGMAAMALVLTTACSRNEETYQPSKEEIMANAEERLGIAIDPALDWNMTSQGRACITVNGNYGETYTVKIYSNDPIVDKRGYVLKKGEVKSGETFIADFDYPSAMTWITVGVTDSRGFTNYRPVRVNDGLLVTTIGSAPVAETRSPMRSRTAPSVPQMGSIPTNEYAKSFLEGAVEPNDQNIYNNNKSWVEGTPESYEMGTFHINFNTASEADKEWFEKYVRPFIQWQFDIYGTSDREKAWEVLVGWIKETNRTSWLNLIPGTKGHWQIDPNYTDHFKITGTYDKIIGVMESEGDFARTMYISGKWTIPEWQTQKVGGGAVIVVDNGGELYIPANTTMTFVNQARLIVMPGGKVTGEGTLLVTNGNAAGKESYNGGTIDLGKFNNNFGKFYNYGTLRANIYAAGGGESNFYNHGVAHIVTTYSNNNSESPNARIFNACQWYCEYSMNAFIVENTQGSYFFVGGTLVMSNSNDGTSETSYVSLDNGSLMRLGALSNNNCDWNGPTSGYAVVEMGRVNYLNWTGEGPIARGFFQNNIAVSVDDKTNNCLDSDQNAYTMFSRYVANGIGTNGNTKNVGNGGVTFVERFGASVIVPRDENFVAGVSGCTPGYQGVGGGIVEETPTETPDPDPVTPTESNVEGDVPAVWTYAFEDTPQGDYDMNDVVIKVRECPDNDNELEVTLCCVGASFDLHLYLNDRILFDGLEVHRVLRQPSGALVNTGTGIVTEELVPTRITKPANFSFADADFWIDSQAVPGGVHIARTGEDPHAVAIPGDWKWPMEYVSITQAYPNFRKFIADVDCTDQEAQQWYKVTNGNPVADKIYNP